MGQTSHSRNGTAELTSEVVDRRLTYNKGPWPWHASPGTRGAVSQRAVSQIGQGAGGGERVVRLSQGRAKVGRQGGFEEGLRP